MTRKKRFVFPETPELEGIFVLLRKPGGGIAIRPVGFPLPVAVCLCRPGVEGRIHPRSGAGTDDPLPKRLREAVLIVDPVRGVGVKLDEGLLPGIVKSLGDPGEILVV